MRGEPGYRAVAEGQRKEGALKTGGGGADR